MRSLRAALVVAAFASAALALPAAASATDYCFGTVSDCATPAIDDGELQNYLTAAESNGTADRFFLRLPTFKTPVSYQSSEPVEIIGAGADKTVLTGSAPGAVLLLGGNPESSVSNLTIKPTGSAGMGLRLAGSDAHGVAVDATAAPALMAGVGASGGATFDDGSVDIGAALMLPALLALNDAATVTDSRLVAPKGYGVSTTAASATTVRRSTLDAKYGVSASDGHLAVSDSFVDLRGKGTYAAGPAIGVSVGPGGSVTTADADLERLTIVGSTPDTGETMGVASGANGAAQSATVHLRDSVMSGVGVPISRMGINGATVNVFTDRSLYQDPYFPHDAGTGSLVEERRLRGSPGFVDEAGSDFHLTAGSQLVDAGTPGELPPGTADRDGNPRPTDGDGDGTAVSDVGAFELAGRASSGGGSGSTGTPPAGAPVLSRLSVSPARVTIGARLPKLLASSSTHRAATIGFRLSKRARVVLRFAKLGRGGKLRTMKARVRVRAGEGANRIRFAGRLNPRVRLTSGAYRLTAIAIDGSGVRSKPATARFRAVRPRG